MANLYVVMSVDVPPPSVTTKSLKNCYGPKSGYIKHAYLRPTVFMCNCDATVNI